MKRRALTVHVLAVATAMACTPMATGERRAVVYPELTGQARAFAACIESWSAHRTRTRVLSLLARLPPDDDYVLLEIGAPEPPHYYGYALLAGTHFIHGIGKGRVKRVPAGRDEYERVAAAVEPTSIALNSSLEERVMDGSCYVVTVHWQGTVRRFAVYLGDLRAAELVGERERQILTVLEDHLEPG